jgi:ABC-2 type transport system permease protein
MPNFLIIARREYLERIRTKSFIVVTVLFPILMVGILVGPNLMLTRESGQTKHYLVVASNARTGEALRDELKSAAEKPDSETSAIKNVPNALPKLNLVVDVSTDTSEAHRAALIENVKQKQLDGVIFSSDDDLAARKVVFYSGDISSVGAQSVVRRGISDGVRRDFLMNKGLSQPDIDNVIKSVEMESRSPSGGNPVTVFFTVMCLMMMMFASVIIHGLSVMRAILEEKTSRVMEVMLACARPIELMTGKILGVGAVGLTQVGIWAATGILFGSFGTLSAGLDLKEILSPKLMLSFGLFFLLGYALYSTLCAAIGAIVNSEQETQQLQLPVMLPLIISAVLMPNVIHQGPNSTLAFWASLFPLTAPLHMFLRIAIQTPPMWQVLLSIGLMIATTVVLAQLCARIYRVGILMYGKRPTLPEILKWIKYA